MEQSRKREHGFELAALDPRSPSEPSQAIASSLNSLEGSPLNRTAFQPPSQSLAISKAKFLTVLSACESREPRMGKLAWKARENLNRVMAGAGLTAIYLWTTSSSPRVSALGLDSTGRFFAVELNRAEPVSVAQGWAFTLACREWADTREITDKEAACRWEEAVLRQLQRAEADAGS